MRTGLTKKQIKETLEHCIDLETGEYEYCTGCPSNDYCSKGSWSGNTPVPMDLIRDAIDILNPEYALPELLYRRIRVILLKAIKGKEIDPAEAKELLGWIMRLKKEAENK